ncbi:Protein of unknown function [Sphingobium faniae]|nr:Protein of unknown function [Sphingobium faniae]
MDTTQTLVNAALVGIGGTIIIDLYAFLMQRVFGVPGTNWQMVGRWLGHMPKGQFVHTAIGKADPVPGEHVLGWAFHYAIGVGYGFLLVAIWGAGWLQAPSIAEPLILALALLVLPYFVMMPGLGMGLAGSKTPKPNVTRFKSLVGHSIFGTGMFLTAKLLASTG